MLRSRIEHQFKVDVIPSIAANAETHLAFKVKTEEEVGRCIDGVAEQIGLNHRAAIKAEMKRREEAKQEKIRLQQQIEKETQERRQRRANMRERLRIEALQDFIQDYTIRTAQLSEWRPSMPVLDFRDYSQNESCVYTFGGLLGEVILVLSTVNDYILSLPSQYNSLSFFDIENYLTSMLQQTPDLPKEALKLELVSDPSVKPG